MTTFEPSQMIDPPLLRTKISVPLIQPEFVHRPRLTQQLDRGALAPLTLLAAPAGFGKTNLLIEWTKSTPVPVAWLNLDSEDNDLRRFYRYLIGALQSLRPRLGEEALDFLQSTRGSGLEVGLTLLINDLAACPGEMVLVMDDFQVLAEPTILESINYLLKHLPHNLHLVVASRSEPALDLAFLRAKGRVIEVDMEDLRFTKDEVAEFFQKTMGMQLSAETLHLLEKRTDGWITGLQMAAISLRHHSDPVALLENLEGSAHFLVDFLAEEVLDRQPEEVRQFLLRSSILKLLNGPLCEAVVNPDAQPGYGVVMLNRLEHAQLFIETLDEKREWYRYHNLFADFLRHIQAEINPAETPVLQKRAALWFEENGNLGEAFRYALASGDVEWAAQLIERNIEAMIKTGEIFFLNRWISQLPEAVIRESLRLSLVYAWGSVAAYQIDQAQDWVDHIEQLLLQADQSKDAPDPIQKAGPFTLSNASSSWNYRGGLAICQSTLALLNGDAEKAAQYSKLATGFLGEDNPFIQSLLALDSSLYYVLSGDTRKAIESLRETIKISRRANNLFVMIIATCQLAEMQALQGQMTRAWATLQKAEYMAVGPRGVPLSLAGFADIGFGEILLERNAVQEAQTHLERGIETTGSLWWLSNLDGIISLAHLRQIQGDIQGSQAIIKDAARMALNTDSGQWDDTVVSSIAVRLALRRGDLDAAQQWWQRGAFPDYLTNIHLANYPYHIYEYLVLTQVRLLSVIGKQQGNESYLHRCLDLLEALLVDAKRFQRLTSQIEILVLKAVVLHALGQAAAAVKTFREALALGEPEGYRRIYLDGGGAVKDLLCGCLALRKGNENHLPSPEFIESLLASLQEEALPAQSLPGVHKPEKEALVVKAEDGLPISLSAREMEVLRLIAEGKSNQEIAAQLFLALNTVKRHAYHIYAKLQVKKRTQAVSRARQLKLIA